MQKKILLWVSGVFLILAALVLIAPLLFKEQLKKKILEEVDSRIDAEINFSDVSVSSFTNFPHLTFRFHDFLIVGKEKFKNDTLAYAKTFAIAFDVFAVLKGRDIKIKSIGLYDPIIHIKILKDGSANYNIALPDTSHQKDTSHFEIDVDKWMIKNGEIIYDDDPGRTLIILDGVTHNGNGDFTQAISDLNIVSHVEELTYAYNGFTYFKRKRFKTDLIIEMDLKEHKFTFKDHVFEINHFKFGFEGYFKLLERGYELDMKFNVKETSFKSILSVLPGYFIKDFEKMKTSGEFECNGHVKGIYDIPTNRIPTFKINLKVKDGYVKYEHLPKAMENIQMHMVAENKDGIVENTLIDLKKFHLDMGGNPISGRLKLNGLGKGFIDADIKASVNLAEIEKIYPVEGFTLKGMLKTEIKATGNYDDSLKTFPVVDAMFTLDSGYVLSRDYSMPIEHIFINAEMQNSTGRLADTRISLYKANYTFEDEPVTMSGTINDLVNYNYDLMLKGTFDFDKLTRIYPVPGVTVSGLLDIALETKGTGADLQAKNFKKLTTQGSAECKNMKLISGYIPNALFIDDAYFSFDPDKIVLEKFKANYGKSNISLTGHVFNYLSFMLDKDTPFQGDLEMYCDSLDLNEWTADPAKVKDTTQNKMQIVEIPKNVNFTFDSDIKYVKFNKMDMHNIKGEIKIHDGMLTLHETAFNTVNAGFTINCSYDTRDIKHPLFDLVMDIEKLDIDKALDMFGPAQPKTPENEKTDGILSTSYKVKGELGPDFMPIYESLTGKGRIVIAEAEMKGIKVLQHVSRITKKDEMSNPKVKDIVMETEIKGGKIFIKPFSFQMSKFVAELEGIHKFDNTMNYLLKISVPPFNKLKIPFHISGTTDKPIVKLGKGHENYDFDQLK